LNIYTAERFSEQNALFMQSPIKTMKFSHMAPVCGGLIEVAVITADRPFRWVRHKDLDSAIGDGIGRD
jgi:hypothetical protein